MPKLTQKISGFSLVEVMIAVAIVVLLIVGVTQVFKYTADTISSSLAVSEVTRSQRGAQTTFEIDLAGFDSTSAVPSPALLIRCEINNASVAPDVAGLPLVGPRFLDRQAEDEYAASPPTTPAQQAVYQFRTDILGFFATGNFNRTSANDLSYVSGIASTQAWINYSHLQLPDNAGAYSASTMPGASTGVGANPNNYFARKWILGRQVILLKQKNVSDTAILGDTSSQVFITTSTAGTMGPLASGSLANTTAAPGGTTYAIQQSRFDLAGTQNGQDPFSYFAARITAFGAGDWWTPLIYRFQCNPYPTKPVTSLGIAQTAPMFVNNCSDFRVAFAGDFGTQNATTGAAAAGPAVADGILDFEVETHPVTSAPMGIKKTKWYSLGNAAGTFYGAPFGFEKSNSPFVYVCAFLPTDTGLRMIRLTTTTHDGNGRLADGQTGEYIIQLRHN